jgi:hypothetical protein
LFIPLILKKTMRISVVDPFRRNRDEIMRWTSDCMLNAQSESGPRDTIVGIWIKWIKCFVWFRLFPSIVRHTFIPGHNFISICMQVLKNWAPISLFAWTSARVMEMRSGWRESEQTYCNFVGGAAPISTGKSCWNRCSISEEIEAVAFASLPMTCEFPGPWPTFEASLFEPNLLSWHSYVPECKCRMLNTVLHFDLGRLGISSRSPMPPCCAQSQSHAHEWPPHLTFCVDGQCQGS